MRSTPWLITLISSSHLPGRKSCLEEVVPASMGKEEVRKEGRGDVYLRKLKSEFKEWKSVNVMIFFLLLASLPLTMMWNVDHAHQRWRSTISVFAHIFLAEGPGNERGNFLNAHAGFASRMSRQVSYGCALDRERQLLYRGHMQ